MAPPWGASKLAAERAHAMDCDNGDMSRDMPAADGRSRAVSCENLRFRTNAHFFSAAICRSNQARSRFHSA